MKTVISNNTKTGGAIIPGHYRMQLTDYQRRDSDPTYVHTYAHIPYAMFPKDSPEFLDEKKRLRSEMLIKNNEWRRTKKCKDTMQLTDNIEKRDDIIVTKEIPLTKEKVLTKDAPLNSSVNTIKYDKVCLLDLDSGTGNTIFICASSKAGKTTLMMHLYNKYFTKYISIMFAHNPQSRIYKQKNLIVTDQFEPDIIEIQRQVNKVSNNKFNFLDILDDQLSVKTDVINDMFLSLRNSNISSIISLQYINLMSKACRGNVNMVFLGSMNSDENILVAIKCYLIDFMHSSGMRTEAEMISHYRMITSKHGFIYIHPASNMIRFCRLSL